MAPGPSTPSGAEPDSRVAPEPAPTPDADRGAFGTSLGTAASVPAGPPGERVTTFSLSGWAVARYTLIAALVLNGMSLFSYLHEPILLLLLAIIFATAIEPLVQRLRRGPFSRGQGIMLIYSALFFVLASIGFLFVPSLVGQASSFGEALPTRIAALRPRLEQIESPALRAPLLRAFDEAEPAVQRGLRDSAGTIGSERLLETGMAFGHALIGVVTVFLLAFYWLTERATIKRAVLRLVGPSRARRVNESWLDVEEKLGAWVRGQLLIMLALGVMAGVVFALLGLPNPIFLAVLAGLLNAIPMIGSVLSFLPAILVALTIEPMTALMLIPLAIVMQQIEGNVLTPRIMSQAVGVSPLTVIVGIMVGSSLYGAVGAFLAVPVAAAIQVILGELHPALDEGLDPLEEARAKLRRNGRPLAGRGRDAEPTPAART